MSTPVYELVLGANGADYVGGAETGFAQLYRRDPMIPTSFATVFTVDLGAATEPAIIRFTVDPTNTLHASVFEPSGSGSHRTNNGLTWTNSGLFVQARDFSNGDCYSAQSTEIRKSTDNGDTSSLFLDATTVAPGAAGSIAFLDCTVLDNVVWFLFDNPDEPVATRFQLWKINTNGTGLTRLTWTGTLTDVCNIYGSIHSNRVWIWAAESFLSPTVTIWRIDTSTSVVTQLSSPTKTNRDVVAHILSTSNSRVLCYVVDKPDSAGGTHSSAYVLYESTDDGVTWVSILNIPISGIPNSLERNGIRDGGDLIVNPLDSTHFALIAQVPFYYESLDDGVTWIQKSFNPALQYPHWSCIGFAELGGANSGLLPNHYILGG